MAYNQEDFTEICTRGLDLSPTNELLIDESLLGWKEFEMEVVRDKRDNCIIVCSIENLDPMGIRSRSDPHDYPSTEVLRRGGTPDRSKSSIMGAMPKMRT